MQKTYISDDKFKEIIGQVQVKTEGPAFKAYSGSMRYVVSGQMATLTIVSKEDIEHFKELVQRGTNLWPDAPPQIKELADLITNGKVMQDYFAQAGVVTTNPLEK